jgi:hypothetical protein
MLMNDRTASWSPCSTPMAPPTATPVVFAEYARSTSWTGVHVGQFACVALFIAGLFVLFFLLDVQEGAARWASRFGALSAAVAMALYGLVMAVDGIALKQAVNAWVSAPDAEKAARFATAETMRWLEWGTRSYENFALGLALLLFAAAVARTAWVPRPIAFLMMCSGLTYLVQAGWQDRRGFRARRRSQSCSPKASTWRG